MRNNHCSYDVEQKCVAKNNTCFCYCVGHHNSHHSCRVHMLEVMYHNAASTPIMKHSFLFIVIISSSFPVSLPLYVCVCAFSRIQASHYHVAQGRPLVTHGCARIQCFPMINFAWGLDNVCTLYAVHVKLMHKQCYATSLFLAGCTGMQIHLQSASLLKGKQAFWKYMLLLQNK